METVSNTPQPDGYQAPQPDGYQAPQPDGHQVPQPDGYRVAALAIGGGLAPLAALVAILGPGRELEGGAFAGFVSGFVLAAVLGVPLVCAGVARAATGRGSRAAWQGACAGLLVSALGVTTNFVRISAAVTKPEGPRVSAADSSWSTYTSKNGDYRVSFPGTPAVEARNGGESATVMKADAGFAAAHVPQAPHTHPGELFAMVAERYRESFAGATVEDRAVFVNGRIGRELDIRGADGQDLRIRLFVVNDVLYQVSVNSPPPLDDELAERFLDSFRLATAQPVPALDDDVVIDDAFLLDEPAGDLIDPS